MPLPRTNRCNASQTRATRSLVVRVITPSNHCPVALQSQSVQHPCRNNSDIAKSCWDRCLTEIVNSPCNHGPIRSGCYAEPISSCNRDCVRQTWRHIYLLGTVVAPCNHSPDCAFGDRTKQAHKRDQEQRGQFVERSFHEVGEHGGCSTLVVGTKGGVISSTPSRRDARTVGRTQHLCDPCRGRSRFDTCPGVSSRRATTTSAATLSGLKAIWFGPTQGSLADSATAGLSAPILSGLNTARSPCSRRGHSAKGIEEPRRRWSRRLWRGARASSAALPPVEIGFCARMVMVVVSLNLLWDKTTKLRLKPSPPLSILLVPRCFRWAHLDTVVGEKQSPPSPRPSPPGRGRHGCRLGVVPTRRSKVRPQTTHRPDAARLFSLSPQERGKPAPPSGNFVSAHRVRTFGLRCSGRRTESRSVESSSLCRRVLPLLGERAEMRAGLFSPRPGHATENSGKPNFPRPSYWQKSPRLGRNTLHLGKMDPHPAKIMPHSGKNGQFTQNTPFESLAPRPTRFSPRCHRQASLMAVLALRALHAYAVGRIGTRALACDSLRRAAQLLAARGAPPTENS